jgi:hypothetical protein
MDNYQTGMNEYSKHNKAILKKELAFRVVPELVMDVGDALEEDCDADVEIDVAEEEASLPTCAVEDDSVELDVIVEVMTVSPCVVVGVIVVVLELETVFSTAFPQYSNLVHPEAKASSHQELFGINQ